MVFLYHMGIVHYGYCKFFGNILHGVLKWNLWFQTGFLLYKNHFFKMFVLKKTIKELFDCLEDSTVTYHLLLIRTSVRHLYYNNSCCIILPYDAGILTSPSVLGYKSVYCSLYSPFVILKVWFSHLLLSTSFWAFHFLLSTCHGPEKYNK